MGRFTSRNAVRALRNASIIGALLATQLVSITSAEAAVVIDGKIDDAYTGLFVNVPYGGFTGRVAVVEEADAYYIAFEQDRIAKSNAYCADKKTTPNCFQVFNSLVGSDYISLQWTISGRTIYVPVDILKADATAPSGYSGKAGAGDGGSISGILPAAVQGRSAMDHNLNGLGWRDFVNSPNWSSTPNHPYVYASQIEVRLDKTLGLLASGLDLTRPTVVPHNSPNAAMPPIAPPTIVTTSNPTGTGVAPGTSVRDTAVLTGVGGTPTGTVSFFLCGPTQVTAAGCPSGGTQIGSAVTLNNGSATSAATTATTAMGTYCWRAAYSGDGTYPAATHTNATTECFTVSQLTPSIATTSSPTGANVVPGTSVTDTATLTGTGGTPTGTVTFFLCSPAQATASGCPSGGSQIGSAVALVNGSATSAATTNTTTAGTYCWRAQYSGDASYGAGSHTNATSECFTVSMRDATISTQSSPSGGSVAPGTSVSDTATLSGVAGTPTGTVSFFLCAPAQVTGAGCPSGAGTQIGGAVTLVGGSATSASTTSAIAVGSYCWRVSYSGDSVYNAGSHTNTTSECFTVGLQSVTISTQSSPSTTVAPGSSASDTATVSGIVGTPTGTVSFFLCGPAQVTGAGCPAGGTAVGGPVVLINGSATSPSTTATTTEGRYCWRAEYSGNAVYSSSSHTNATSECFTAQRLVPSVSTTASGTGIDQDPGVTVSDLAHLSGTAGVPTGTVSFFLCSPSQVTAAGCASGGTQVGGAVTLNASGDATSATTSATTAIGTYCWRAVYSGDTVYAGASHTNATSECFTVVDEPESQLDPTIATTSDPSGGGVVPGDTVRDVATVTGPPAGAVPTGSVSFFLCGPAQVSASGCVSGGTQIGAAVVLNASGQATSASTTNTTTVGRYCWRAEYSGDANYFAGTHTNSSSECFTTAKLTPEITTDPKPDAANVGDPIYDTATVTGGSYPTGTVRFELFGPSDPDCSGNPVFIDTQTLSGGRASSDTYRPSVFGRFRWIATYSGDARHASATHGCQVEVVVITEVLGELIPNLPVTGVSTGPLQLFGLLLMSLGAVLVPTLLRSRRVDTIIERRPQKR